MNPTSFRAYALATAISRLASPDGPDKANFEHDVHESVAEGTVSGGIAAFSSKVEIAYVAFYEGEGDETVCVGRLDGPFSPGKISADFADIPEEPVAELADGEVVIGGTSYRKAD